MLSVKKVKGRRLCCDEVRGECRREVCRSRSCSIVELLKCERKHVLYRSAQQSVNVLTKCIHAVDDPELPDDSVAFVL